MSGSAGTDLKSRVISSDAAQFPCAEGDTLLRAALRAGVAAAYECNSGGCGTCTFLPTHGQFRQVREEPAGLSARARRKGRLLACQSLPVGDCSVELSLRLDHDSIPVPERRIGVVVDRRELTHDLTQLTLQTDEAAVFLPGQYAMLALDSEDGSGPIDRLRGERAYSMSNLANPAGLWQFQVKEVPGGAVSVPLARQAKIGTRLRMDGAYGHAYLRDTSRNIVCIAGGSGLAPMVSIARGFAASSGARDRRVHFLYGGRGVRDLCASEFVSEIADQLEQATLVEVLSGDDVDGWGGLTGFVHEAVRGPSLPDLTSHDVYVAGPPAMTDAVVRVLVFELNVPADQIHYDRFF